MTPTEKQLVEIYGSPTLDTRQLAHIFHLKDRYVVLEAIRCGRFPVRTYKLGRHQKAPRVAEVVDVAAYLDTMRGTPVGSAAA